MNIELGVDSFASIIPGAGPTLTPAERMANLLTQVEYADQAGLDAFGIGEHHRAELVDSAPAVILGPAAARTESIRLQSAVTVLGAADPVRVFQDFATIDLISNGRAEIVAGRGSSVEAYSLFGHRLDDRDALFLEKLELLLKLRAGGRDVFARRFAVKGCTRGQYRPNCRYGWVLAARQRPLPGQVGLVRRS